MLDSDAYYDLEFYPLPVTNSPSINVPVLDVTSLPPVSTERRRWVMVVYKFPFPNFYRAGVIVLFLFFSFAGRRPMKIRRCRWMSLTYWLIFFYFVIWINLIMFNKLMKNWMSSRIYETIVKGINKWMVIFRGFEFESEPINLTPVAPPFSCWFKTEISKKLKKKKSCGKYVLCYLFDTSGLGVQFTFLIWLLQHFPSFEVKN